MKKSERISVLFVTRKFPPGVGGMERYAFDLYKALLPDATVYLVKWGGKNKYLPAVLPLFFVRCCWILATKRVDVIHVQDAILAPMAGVLKSLFRKPALGNVHGLDLTYEKYGYQWMIPPAVARLDHVFCNSHSTMQQAEEHGVPATKLQVIPLGITDDLYGSDHQGARARVLERTKIRDKNARLLLATGRLVKRKGVNWFIDAVMPELINKDPHMMLLVSGDGPDREAIAATIRRRKLARHVMLLGRTDNEFIRDLYNGCDVYVMPNITVPRDMEGFGRVALEAALCELPVLATGIEGIRDAIQDGKNGTLIAEKDVAAYVRAITTFTAHPQARQAFGKAARQYTLATFNWNKIVQQFLAAYDAARKNS